MVCRYDIDSLRLDALVNNAALGWQEGTPANKYAQAFATNATGPLLVTDAFEPLLSKSLRTPRIINVSSEGHKMAPGIIYDQAKLESYATWRRYGQSKLANILHARELQRRYPAITATSVHPGVVKTKLFKNAGIEEWSS